MMKRANGFIHQVLVRTISHGVFQHWARMLKSMVKFLSIPENLNRFKAFNLQEILLHQWFVVITLLFVKNQRDRTLLIQIRAILVQVFGAMI